MNTTTSTNFLGSHLAEFLVGFYPADEHWRVGIAGALAAVVALWLWRSGGRRPVAWLAFMLLPAGIWAILAGGWAGLTYVPPAQWGGLTLTLLLTLAGIGWSLPLAIALALMRLSELKLLRTSSIVLIEVVRGVPLVSLLFMSSVMLPLFLPGDRTTSELARALVALVIFAAAYQAEVVRAGILAVGRGQIEAAAALGLNATQRLSHIVLPQALGLTVPALVNAFVALLKDTTLVLVIGMFDLLGIVQAAASKPQWLGHAMQGYLFAGAVYWALCLGLSRLSRRWELSSKARADA